MLRADDRKDDTAASVNPTGANLGGTVDKADGSTEAVKMTITKDGRVEVAVDGKKIAVDTATQRQIRRHIGQALRLAAEGQDAVTR